MMLVHTCKQLQQGLKLRVSFPTIQHVRSIRGGRGPRFPPGDLFPAGEQEDPFTFVEQMERLEDELALDASLQRSEERFREEEKHKRTVIYKIIERKYFKKPQEKNLLTWEAKEQMRYLHNEYPDEWTIDKLAASFPTSRTGVINILKSTFYPKSIKDVVKHDKRVQKNWLALKAGGEHEGGPIMLTYQHLLEKGKMATLQNASGIKSLPKPDLQKLFMFAKPQLGKPNTGKFESLVKDYCEQKALPVEEIKSIDDETKFLEHCQTSQLLLEGVTSELTQLMPSVSEETPTLKSGPPPRPALTSLPSGAVNYQRAFANVDNTMESMQDAVSSQPANAASLQTLLDADLSDYEVEHLRNREGVQQRRSLRRRKRSGLSGVKIQQLEEKQMEGTGKINSAAKTMEEHEQINNSIQTHRFDEVELDSLEEENLKVTTSSNAPEFQYEVSREEMGILDSVILDKRGGIEDMPEDAYLFDDEKGYQYPFGKTDESLADIEVPQKLKSKDQLIQKGKNFYDVDGEFLFRVP